MPETYSEWRCAECGWTCTANPDLLLVEAECDHCGGELEEFLCLT
jgi:hypothetical protein